jgi:hypothetical protein
MEAAEKRPRRPRPKPRRAAGRRRGRGRAVRGRGRGEPSEEADEPTSRRPKAEAAESRVDEVVDPDAEPS